jgi:hypothetical protein
VDDVALPQLSFDTEGGARLTHQVFRFPAKFHPPVISRLIEDYSRPGERVIDIFCGSGTLLVEAAARNRHAVGIDVDPLSVFLSRAKSQSFSMRSFRLAADHLLERTQRLARSNDEYERRMHVDLDGDEYARQSRKLAVPEIPNLEHWFRKYVVVDLARLRGEIDAVKAPPAVSDALRLVFASIIRGASNADPVPVSGLERTRHMISRDAAGRMINPFRLFEKKLIKATADFQQFQDVRSGSACHARVGDATQRLQIRAREPIHAAITSPPYHGAVDYYRRHQLEMFWLGLTSTQAERLAILDRYLGRPHARQRHPFVVDADLRAWPEVAALETAIRKTSVRRANEFRHYCTGMAHAFTRLAEVLPAKAPAIFIVGHSRWNGTELPTSELFRELASPLFELSEQYWYPVKNRHMSYGRHNGANIDREYALVFRRTRKSVRPGPR